jgi:hypothetical protein
MFMRITLSSLLLVLGFAWVPSAKAETGRFRESLAMFETGADSRARGAADALRGRAGEVSRFQIMPDVWQSYSRSRDYTNPEVAWTVAERILADRIGQFRSTTNREPTALEVYLLWNKPGHFEAAAFDVEKVRSLYRSRAERFANLHSRLLQMTVAQR